jgi:hypothetical protein
VIEAATGRILAADALHTGGIDFTPEIAGKKSLERAGTKIACKLAQALAAFLPSGCFTSCSLPNPTYGGMPFDNAAGFPVPGDDLTTMVETALSQKGLTVSPPLAADYVVTGVISDWGVTMSPMIRIPLIDLLFRAGIMWMKVDMRVLNLDTSEIQADLITVSIEGIEIFGFQFGLNPRDLAREAAERIAERVASLSVVTVSAADSSKTQADRKLRSPITELVVRRQPQGWRFSLPMGASGEIQLQIYDLSGRKVFDSGRVSGHALTWKAQNAVGEPVANGIYVYVVTARTLDGRILKSEVKKLAILR